MMREEDIMAEEDIPVDGDGEEMAVEVEVVVMEGEEGEGEETEEVVEVDAAKLDIKSRPDLHRRQDSITRMSSTHGTSGLERLYGREDILCQWQVSLSSDFV
jgi:hypothetical protein